MNRKGWAIVVFSAITVAGVIVAGWSVFLRTGDRPQQAGDSVAKNAAADDEDGQADAGRVVIGKETKKSGEAKTAKSGSSKSSGKKRDPADYGVLPPVPVDANPQVKKLVDAVLKKDRPERISAMARPKPFDAKSFEADPAAYLEEVEPGRVFQTAQPGPGVPRLLMLSPSDTAVTQGESVVLRVAAPPKSPVSFTSFDCGEFDNRLTSITVQANEDGLAETRLATTPGTINRIHVMAGCPIASGQVRFTVNVRLPDETATAAIARP